MLKLLDPPYVYNVFKDDLDGFIKAIEAARANPIDRSVSHESADTSVHLFQLSYVLERMRMSLVTRRVQNLVETDWKSHAAELLEKWKETGEGPVRIAFMYLCVSSHNVSSFSRSELVD